MGHNDKRALYAAMVVLGFSTLALASAPRWAAALSSALAVMTLVPFVGSRRQFRSMPPLLLLMLIPLGATLLQLIPLPAALVRVLAPARHALAEANALAYGAEVPSFLPMSQDWPATLVALGTFAGYASFSYVCLRLCSSRQARQTLLTAVVAIGALVALCALGHRAFGAKSLLGLYTPYAPYKTSISPFFNPNHLAEYLALVTPVAIGLAMHRKSWLFAAAALLCAGTSLQAVSRGGVVSLSVGVVVAIALIASLPRDRRKQKRASRKPLSIVLGVLAVGIVILGATAGRQLLDLSIEHEIHAGKFLPWGAAMALVAEFPLFGVGRGAFAHSYTSVQPQTGVTFSHVENEYLQIIVDWGLPTALAIGVASLLLIRSLRRRPVDALAAGGIGALVAIAVHSVVDFGIELPGMALPTIAIVATLIPAGLSVQKDKKKRKYMRTIRISLAATAMFACALAFAPPGATVAEDLRNTSEFSPDYQGTPKQILAASAHLANRHPSSYLVATSSARALWHQKDSRAFAALARALDLNPNYYAVHLLAAQLLASSQEPRQALAEYGLAMGIPGGPKDKIVRTLLAHFEAVDDLVGVTPATPIIEGRYANLFLQQGRSDVAEAIALRDLREGHKSLETYKVGVRAAIENKHPSAAVEIGTEAHKRHQITETVLLLASALEASNLPIVALEELDKHIELHSSGDLDVLLMQARLQLQLGRVVMAKSTLEKLLTAASLPHRRTAHLQLATIEERAKNRHRAQWHRDQAAQLRDR